jgi:hypothetical protein
VSRPLLSFAIFFGIALCIVGGMYYYIWSRLVRDTAVAEPWRRLLTIGFVAAAVAVPVAFLTMRARAGALADGFVFGAMLWMGVAFLLLTSLVLVDLARLAVSGLGSLADWLRHAPETPTDPERRRMVARVVAGGAVLAAGGATAFAVTSALGEPQIHEVPVKLASPSSRSPTCTWGAPSARRRSGGWWRQPTVSAPTWWPSPATWWTGASACWSDRSLRWPGCSPASAPSS